MLKLITSYRDHTAPHLVAPVGKTDHSPTSSTAQWMVNCTPLCAFMDRIEISPPAYFTNSLQNIITLGHFSHLRLSLYLKAKWPEKYICTVYCQGTICINDVLHQYFLLPFSQNYLSWPACDMTMYVEGHLMLFQWKSTFIVINIQKVPNILHKVYK